MKKILLFIFYIILLQVILVQCCCNNEYSNSYPKTLHCNTRSKVVQINDSIITFIDIKNSNMRIFNIKKCIDSLELKINYKYL